MKRGAKDRWLELLEVAGRNASHRAKLEALLGQVRDLAGVACCYLYAADGGGRRYTLEHSLTDDAATAVALAEHPLDDHEAAASVAPLAVGGAGMSAPATARAPVGGQVEGGAGAASPTPPLELSRESDREEQVLATAAGRLYSLPLNVDGRAIGRLLLGPLRRGNLPGGTRRELEDLRPALSLAVERLNREHALEQQLSAALAREDAGRKLAGSALDVERFVSLLLDLAVKATGTEAGFVAIVEQDSGRPTVRAQVNLPEDFAERTDLAPETGVFDWSAGAEGGALILRDFEWAQHLGVSSLLAVPLMQESQPLGIFALVNFGEADTFSEHSLDLLGTFAEQIRLMLHNARLFQDFSGSYLETVKGLAHSLDARRPHMAGHHEKVSVVAAILARALERPGAEIEAIRTAGLIHDVGMAAIVELAGGFEADVEHPVLGASLIEHLPLHPAVAGAIATHHEWFDGWGFPRGLKEDEIPVAGRVLALAEFLVEYSTPDPLRPAAGPDQLVAELVQRAGAQFDPKMIDTTIRLVREGALGLEEPAVSR